MFVQPGWWTVMMLQFELCEGVMECPRCESTLLQRNGYRNQIQCYRCTQCGKQFLETYRKTPYSEEVKQHCLALYAQGLSFRKIERLTQIHHTTIAHWFHQAKVAECEKMLLLENQESLYEK
jgi:transposase-like protein